MPELTEFRGWDAISLMVGYYGQRFSAQDTARLVALLSKADVIGLVQYAYKKGLEDERRRK